MMKSPICLAVAAACLACSGSGLFAAELGDARAVIDEVVADISFQIPLARTPMPFENFRYPYIGPDGTVTFIGNDQQTFGAEANEGIYRSSPDGKLTPLVKQEEIAQDDGKPIGVIMGLQTDFDSITFHRGPDDGVGIYGFFQGGALSMVANRQTAVPGKSQLFTRFWYSDISERRVVFNGTYQVNGDEVHGLYLYRHADRKLLPLIDESQRIAKLGGTKLSYLSYQPRIDPSWLVFSASRKREKNQEPIPGRGILGWSLSGAGTEEEKLAPGKLQVLAPFGMILPESGGKMMTSAPNPVVAEGIVAVMAGSDRKDFATEYPEYQALCVRTPDGVWHNPLDTETLIPGRSDGATFSYINKWVAAQDGQVIFRVAGPNGYHAIYIYNVTTDVLYFVVDNLREIDGKKVHSFETSTHPLSGQRLALMVRFEDKTFGEYLATLPGLAVQTKKRPVASR